MSPNNLKKESIFGTDGIRGTPGIYPLTDGMIFKIGLSIAKIIKYKENENKSCSCVVIGRDTRLTGSRIEAILADAINFHGIDVLSAGVITTPGLSFLVREHSSQMGIMISASHNKAEDNGIKLFNNEGLKLSYKEEEFIENVIVSNIIHRSNEMGKHRIGLIKDVKGAHAQYANFLIRSLSGSKLRRMRVALDCGWGAASGFAPALYKKLGLNITSIHDEPNGENINIGGALKPSYLSDLVIKEKADIGIALDGDGDRCILVDEKGNVLDGDYILAIMGNYLADKGKLSGNTVAVTVMSNLGLKISLEKKGVKMIVTKVGDKNVVEALREHNLDLGGEQSGHIVFMNHLSSPDGLLVSLQILKVMSDTGKSLSELAGCMKKFPQVLVNVPVKKKVPFNELPSVYGQLDYYKGKLKDDGRILLRYSGTEDLARVMVEGRDERLINEIAGTMAETIKKELGASR